MNIGDVEIPIVNGIQKVEESDVQEIKPFYQLESVPVKHESSVTTLNITAFLNPQLHSESLSLDEQKREINSLKLDYVESNSFVFEEYKGHLMIENVDITDDGTSKIIEEVEIEARYLPWPKFFPESEPQ